MGGDRSHSYAENFYGPITHRLPSNMFQSFINPMLMGFGAGDKADRWRTNNQGMTGPLADYMRQVGGMSGSIIPQSQQLGADIAARAPQLYNQLQGQISSSLAALPGLQQSGQGAVDRAQWLVDQAFSPITGRALYGETMNRALGQERQGQAARGLMEQGTAQQSEQGLGRDLAYQFAMNDQANQGGSIDRLLGSVNNQVGLTQAGLQPAAMGMDALSNYFGLQANALNFPMQTAGNYFQLLTGGLPAAQALQTGTGPTTHADTKGWKI